jgi:hypothetical protein
MKKRSAIKALAFVLVLLTAFGVTASAIEGDPPPTPPTEINITVGQIYPLKQLVEAFGYTYNTGVNVVSSVKCSGAVNAAEDGGIWSIYGTAAGQGSVTINFRDRTPKIVFDGFHVTAAANPLVREMSVTTNEHFSIAPLLADLGYTPEDIERSTNWDIKISAWDWDADAAKTMPILYGGGASYQTPGNGRGVSQILLNMKDGQVILINLKVGDKHFSWSGLGAALLEPLVSFLTPFGWFLIPLSPVLLPVWWIDALVRLFSPEKYHQVRPELVF